jgi:cytidine deaminase
MVLYREFSSLCKRATIDIYQILHMEVSEEQIQEAIRRAQKAQQNSFSFWHRPCGACVIASDGTMYAGANVESNMNGLGICSERCAIDTAVTNGKYEYKAIVTSAIPCGMCLQYFEMFSRINDTDFDIIVFDEEGKYEVHKYNDLLPKQADMSKYIDKLKAFTNKDDGEIH